MNEEKDRWSRGSTPAPAKEGDFLGQESSRRSLKKSDVKRFFWSVPL
jgi:hypothetical protein